MSLSLTAMIGALVALLPPALMQPKDKESEAVKLARSNARLIDHIHSLEQELLTERHTVQTLTEQAETMNRDLSLQRELAHHWREEAMRIARTRATPQDGRQYAQPNQALAQQSLLGALQAQVGMQSQADQQQAFGGFCNCVPSRAQVWGAQQGLVQRLNNHT